MLKTLMMQYAEVLTVTSNHVRETSQNQVWSSIRGLTDSLTKTNELLQKEREYSRKLEKEILDLKMRLFEQEMKTAISKDNEKSPSKAGASLRDELINNSFPRPPSKSPRPPPPIAIPKGSYCNSNEKLIF